MVADDFFYFADGSASGALKIEAISDFVNLIDAGDPAEQAKIYYEQGADEICFLDITATNENRDIILDTVKKTAEKCFIPLTVGGGVRKMEDITNLLLAGADKVSINSAIVKDLSFLKKTCTDLGLTKK